MWLLVLDWQLDEASVDPSKGTNSGLSRNTPAHQISNGFGSRFQVGYRYVADPSSAMPAMSHFDVLDCTVAVDYLDPRLGHDLWTDFHGCPRDLVPG